MFVFAVPSTDASVSVFAKARRPIANADLSADVLQRPASGFNAAKFAAIAELVREELSAVVNMLVLLLQDAAEPLFATRRRLAVEPEESAAVLLPVELVNAQQRPNALVVVEEEEDAARSEPVLVAALSRDAKSFARRTPRNSAFVASVLKDAKLLFNPDARRFVSAVAVVSAAVDAALF